MAMLGLTIRSVAADPISRERRTEQGSDRSILKVIYLYRDASNHKFWGEFHVLGPLSLAALEPYLFDGEFFIPERIGLPSLVPEIKNDDDHLLHAFVDIEAAMGTRYVLTGEELLDRVARANAESWFAGIS